MSNPKVCLLSDYEGIIDEGMRVTAFYFQRNLSQDHELLHLQVKELLSWSGLQKIRGFHPDIIHLIPGPTLKSFILLKTLKTLFPYAKTVMSATHLALLPYSLKIIPLLKPDIILTQSIDSEKKLANANCRVRFLSSGVDLEQYRPSDARTKAELRRKYCLDVNRPVILHVGSITKRRNICLFPTLSEKVKTQVLIIGSLSIPLENDVYEFLTNKGCRIIREYVPNLQEIYALADCYVFPTVNPRAAIEIPLTVLEAMACNLPVVSTRFGALPRIFDEGDGLLYANDPDEFVSKLKMALSGNLSVNTRKKALPYSWANIKGELKNTYAELLDHKNDQ
jgi:glycosyltransferase involved in cell wall biosynthesis